jgi:hypothetical protein
VVKYVKQNFLYNRAYHNLETLNDEAIAWLERTANALPHAFTRKEPHTEWIIEQPFLKPYQGYSQKTPALSSYTVRKNNAILYGGNLYSLPLGTYQGRESLVNVCREQDHIIISDIETKQEICRHKIAAVKGTPVLNTDHKRDKSAAIQEMIDELCCLLPDAEKGREWLNMIRADKPRYIRDQTILIRDTISGTEPDLIEKALDYCLANNICSGGDFKAILAFLAPQAENLKEKVIRLNPLSGALSENALLQPEKSKIEDYQAILNKS